MLQRLLFVFFFFIFHNSFGQNPDTIYMDNGHVLIGEIKIMENGILKVETDYSENDFTIEWEDVMSLKTQTNFIILLTNKVRFNGKISPDPNNPEYLIIFPEKGSKMFARAIDIVYLKSLKSSFWDRISANINAGINLTKASNNKQFSVAGDVSYLYTRVQFNGYINSLYNVVQDSIKTTRNNYGASMRVFFNQSWFVLGAADLLHSDEQNLDLRTTVQVGPGRSLVRNYKMYLTTAFGAALNSEKFITEDAIANQSIEGFGEVEFNAYGLKDVRITTKIQYFLSFKERGRGRLNYTFDAKFDLPKDFYIGGNLTYNYDSKDDTEGAKSDYVVQSTVGWSF